MRPRSFLKSMSLPMMPSDSLAMLIVRCWVPEPGRTFDVNSLAGGGIVQRPRLELGRRGWRGQESTGEREVQANSELLNITRNCLRKRESGPREGSQDSTRTAQAGKNTTDRDNLRDQLSSDRVPLGTGGQVPSIVVTRFHVDSRTALVHGNLSRSGRQHPSRSADASDDDQHDSHEEERECRIEPTLKIMRAAFGLRGVASDLRVREEAELRIGEKTF